jgi:dipeptidyl aminopeptidase/acylaminoacyl peptidase
MKPAKVFILSAMLFATILTGQNRPAANGMPPLIDREIFFGNPEIAGAQLSPDGRYLAFLKPWNNVLNIWVKKIGEPFSGAHVLTTELKRPIPAFLWTRDGKYVCYVKDHEGDENYNVYAVDPAAPVPHGVDAPPSRDLTGLKGVLVMLYSAPKSAPDTLYIGINNRDKSWHDLYKLKISTGERTLMRQNNDRVGSWIFDLKGELRLADRTADNGDTEVLRVDPDALTKIYSCSVFETCDVLRFNKEGTKVYLETNKGDAADLVALALLDPATGAVETVEQDPQKRVDLEAAVFSERTEELAQTNYVDDRTRRYFHDKSFEADYRWLEETKFPGKEVGVASRTQDELLWLITVKSDTEPGETWLFDRKAHTLTMEYKVREKVPRDALSPMQPVRYKSSDNLEIPAYLTLPKGLPGKNLPTLIVPHGGPWARDNWGYNPLAQFFANRGYAVLMPNFRGSTGYGKKFLNAGNGEWGRKMQDDITWGVKYLVKEGIADPKRIGILGGSYGGYASLAGVTFTPDLYKAAVDIVGPSNLLTLLDSIPPYWETARKMMYARMADPSTPEGKRWMQERSPLTSAAKIKTALMVVQGANDPRVNRAEAEQIVIALRDRGFPVEYLLAPDEGHGFARPVNNMAMYMAAEKFLAKHLEGRYQEGGTPEVAQRLAEITVDPKTVKLTKKVDASAVTAPKPAMDLKPGAYKYQVKVSMGGQEMDLSSTVTVNEEEGAWVVAQASESPMGSLGDTVIVEKGALTARKRRIQQGPISGEIDYANGRATGKLRLPTGEKEIAADMGGPVFGDGASAPLSIACLPLAEGYTTAYRNYDLAKMKAALWQLKVTGSEKVTVPAGAFEAFKVESDSADGGSEKIILWIAKDSRQVVKSVISGQGGATIVSELQ